MADLADMIKKLAFYQAGGKDPGTDTLDKVNAGAGIVDSTIKDVLAIKKAHYENRKTSAEAAKAEQEGRPAGYAENIPSIQEEAAQKTGILNRNSTRVPENIYPQPTPMQEEAPPKVLGQQIPVKEKFASRREEFTNRTGMNPDLSVPMNVQASLYGLRGAQTDKITSDPTRKTMGEVLPSMDDIMIQARFGPGVNRQTPYSIAMGLGKLAMQQNKNGRMFPVSALSPEGQAAAHNSGLPDYIPESTARIINGANPIRLPSAEESTSLATAESIQDKINQVYQMLPQVSDQALGFGKYQINKYGQYIPFMETDPNISSFYTNINSINNAMIYFMSGKQINEEEGKRIKSELLEAELNPDAFQSRLAQVMHNFSYLRTLKDRGLSDVGKRTPSFGGTNPEAKSNAQTTTPPPGGAWDAVKESRYQELLKKQQTGGN